MWEDAITERNNDFQKALSFWRDREQPRARSSNIVLPAAATDPTRNELGNNSAIVINDKRYQITQILGSGTTGSKVFKVQLLNGRYRAFKLLPSISGKQLDAAKAEVANMQKAGIEGCKLHYDSDKGVALIEMPVAEGQRFHEILNDLTNNLQAPVINNLRKLPDKERQEKTITLSQELAKVGGNIEKILESLQGLHSKGIIHCDCFDKNIFILPDGSVQLIDYGGSARPMSYEAYKDLRLKYDDVGNGGITTPPELYTKSAETNTIGNFVNDTRTLKITESTDLYILMASVYDYLSWVVSTNEDLEPAQQRVNDFAAWILNYACNEREFYYHVSSSQHSCNFLTKHGDLALLRDVFVKTMEKFKPSEEGARPGFFDIKARVQLETMRTLVSRLKQSGAWDGVTLNSNDFKNFEDKINDKTYDLSSDNHGVYGEFASFLQQAKVDPPNPRATVGSVQ